jgi:hypothetical protein
MHDATVDHIVAKANGGPDEMNNLAAMCRRCNGMKQDKAALRVDYYSPHWFPRGTPRDDGSFFWRHSPEPRPHLVSSRTGPKYPRYGPMTADMTPETFSEAVDPEQHAGKFRAVFGDPKGMWSYESERLEASDLDTFTRECQTLHIRFLTGLIRHWHPMPPGAA